MPQHARAARRRPTLTALVLTSAAALLASVLASTGASAAPALNSGAGAAQTSHADRSGRPAFASREVRAKRALHRAQAALSPRTDPASRPDATLALRQLWLLRDALSRADRLAAERLDNRPSYTSTDCSSASACIHWTNTEVTPEWPALVRDTITSVAQTYVAAGYRAPKPDGTLGGDSKIDIYVDNLPTGLYGYCTTDQRINPPKFDVWAYCVLDNDYAGFPSNTPLQNLQVTAAHEFYHAVQFAYDINEDDWFLEATATWAEDELYNDVNDNRQYLRLSPITRPKHSMDKFGGTFHYGVWIYFRFLTERYTTEQGSMPKLPLKMWKIADSSKGKKKNRYSTEAIDKALRKQGTTIEESFALFSDANLRTHTAYSEGTSQHYPVKKLSGGKTLGKKGANKRFSVKLNHLTSSSYRFNSKGLDSKKFKLKLSIDMAPKSDGSRAVVTTYKNDGAVKTKMVRLNGGGNATLKVKFSSKKVAAVEVTLVNASTHYSQCFQRATPFACSGRPLDQARSASVLGTVVKG
jgi:hypothetical protein